MGASPLHTKFLPVQYSTVQYSVRGICSEILVDIHVQYLPYQGSGRYLPPSVWSKEALFSFFSLPLPLAKGGWPTGLIERRTLDQHYRLTHLPTVPTVPYRHIRFASPMARAPTKSVSQRAVPHFGDDYCRLEKSRSRAGRWRGGGHC